MRLNRFKAALAAAALSAVPAAAQPITANQMLRHIEVLAADSYEGRSAGSAGGERAEAYILDQFAKSGLEPGFKGYWRQVVPVTERKAVKSEAGFAIGGRAVDLPAANVVLTGRETLVELDRRAVVFAGYGTAHDLAGVDVSGAVVLALSANPPGKTDIATWAERRAALAKAGAAAVIAVEPANKGWDIGARLKEESLVPSDAPIAPVQGTISNAAARAVLGKKHARKLLAAAERPGFVARRLDALATLRVKTEVAPMAPANIVGRIRGTGDGSEAVVLLSHWDHTGICRPEGAPDRICNGAIDNGSGIAMQIEIARALAAGPKPVRDIYFVATTLEERGGFYGASAFATRGLPEGEKFVAVLNVDTAALHPKGLPVAIIGRGRFPQLDKVIDDTSASLGRKIDRDLEGNIMIERQDGWAFTKLGIPSVMASGSFSDMNILKAYLSGRYHQPNDDLSQKFEFGGAAEDADLHVALLRALADPKIYPSPAVKYTRAACRGFP